MRKNKLYVVLSTLLVLSSFSLVACGEKTVDSSEKSATIADGENIEKASDNVSKSEESKDDEKDLEDEKKSDEVEDKTEAKDSENIKSEEDNKKLESKNEDVSTEKKVEGVNEDNTNKLKYPVFNDIKSSKEINSLVEDFVSKISKSHDNLEMDYKITKQDKDIISIYFSGDISSENLPYPREFKATLNINAHNGTQLKLSNLFAFDSEFVEKFKEELVATCTGKGFEAETVFELENLNELLNSADSSGEYISDVQSYYNESGTNIILSVPHALGDYVEVNLK